MKFGLRKRKNILVLGCDGMLGYDVYEWFLKKAQEKSSGIGIVVGFDRKDLDSICITKRHSLGDYFMNSIHFDYCINCIAMTDTKSAETTRDGRDMSYLLNALVPRWIAESCAYWKTHLIHISTDYVFSENVTPQYLSGSPVGYDKNCTPWPVDIYGTHKLIGEIAIREEYEKKHMSDWTVLRTSWLYGAKNNKSFVHKFIKNLIRESMAGNEVTVTSNEKSFPTSTAYVTSCIAQVVDDGGKTLNGVHHAVCEALRGEPPSRASFAQKIVNWISNEADYCDTKSYAVWINKMKDIKPVERDIYQPKFSALIVESPLQPQNWGDELEKFLNQHGREIIRWAEHELGVS